jgi:hypothetical protein
VKICDLAQFYRFNLSTSLLGHRTISTRKLIAQQAYNFAVNAKKSHFFKLGGLDLSRRDLDRDLDLDLDLDAKKVSVSTVEKISTGFKNWSRLSIGLDALKSRFLSRSRSRSRRQKKVSLDGFQKLVSTLRTFSISICLDVETPKLTFLTSTEILRKILIFVSIL